MSLDKLSAASEAIVKAASRQAITDHFSELVTSGSVGCWVDGNNRYRENASQVFDDDCDQSTATVYSRELASYVAASSPTHLIDGWSFYSRAVEALLRGDNAIAIHLGYYAELRAAMSILASEGIGVFNFKHPVILSAHKFGLIPEIESWNKNQSKYVPKKLFGTHKIVWPLLKYWSSTQTAAQLINKIVCPEGAELSEWLKALGLQSPSAAIAENCFSQWGVDLVNLNEDHKIRNAASYRPSHLRTLADPSVVSVLDFVCESWKAFQPDSNGRFPVIEGQLLKHSLRISGSTLVDPTKLEDELRLPTQKAAIYAESLSSSDASLLISLSTTEPDMTSPRYPLEVLARASLLLFIATGSVREHLFEAGFTDLSFFSDRLVCTRFCCDIRNIPDDYTELWGDIDVSVEATDTWAKNYGKTGSLSEWRMSSPVEANQLPCFELAAIWGLAA